MNNILNKGFNLWVNVVFPLFLIVAFVFLLLAMLYLFNDMFNDFKNKKYLRKRRKIMEKFDREYYPTIESLMDNIKLGMTINDVDTLLKSTSWFTDGYMTSHLDVNNYSTWKWDFIGLKGKRLSIICSFMDEKFLFKKYQWY